MHEIIQIIILSAFLVSSYTIGRIIMQSWFSRVPLLLSITGAFLLGTGIAVPAAYIFSWVFVKTSAPIGWGVSSVIVLWLVVRYLFRHSAVITNQDKLSISDFVLAVFSVLFSFWLMTKTFYGGTEGQLFVGSNNIFDFGHALGIIRSFSWGANIPLTSPFQSGLPFFYHFFFYYWVAIWEYFGVPIVWAMNIPSIISFASLLIVVYFLPQLIFKQTKLTGWVAVILTITNSSLTFWNLLYQKGLNIGFIRYLWNLPTYPFAGPFDGSAISIYMTLNNFVNQRHLAFAIACALLVFMTAANHVAAGKMTVKKSVVFGAASGLLFLWNTAISLSLLFVIGVLYLIYRLWTPFTGYSLAFSVMIAISIAPVARYIFGIVMFINNNFIHGPSGTGQFSAVFNGVSYLWQNLGILPILAVAGVIMIPKKKRMVVIPFIAGFLLLCIFAVVGKRGFDQKFLSFFIISINIMAAVAFPRIVKKYSKRLILIMLILFVIVTISGIVDLFPIKNEFAYPLISADTASVISWIHMSTPKNAVFVSYSDIIDPVVLAGRRNYFGFFGNIGSVDRTSVVARVYDGDVSAVTTNRISYILIPIWKKSDFSYTVNEAKLRSYYPIVYEDVNFYVVALVSKKYEYY